MKNFELNGIIINGVRYDVVDVWHPREKGCDGYHSTPKVPFAKLIDKLNGKDYWESNPDGYAYEFELVK